MSASTVTGSAGTTAQGVAPVVDPAKIQAVVPVSVSTVAKQTIVQRVEGILARIEGDIAHDEQALVAFLKSHL
jgi:hypothetical protein